MNTKGYPVYLREQYFTGKDKPYWHDIIIFLLNNFEDGAVTEPRISAIWDYEVFDNNLPEFVFQSERDRNLFLLSFSDIFYIKG